MKQNLGQEYFPLCEQYQDSSGGQLTTRYQRCQEIGSGKYSKCFRVIKTKCNQSKASDLGKAYALKVISDPISPQNNKQQLTIAKQLYEAEISLLSQFTKYDKQKGKEVLDLGQSKNNVENSFDRKDEDNGMSYFVRCKGYWEQSSASKTKANKYHIVTEYCSNGSLADYTTLKIKNNLLFSSSEVLYFIHQTLLGLNFLHTKLQFVHRDIKLENILLNSDLDVRICDFGISCPKNLKQTKYTWAGTLHYMAPEIAKKTNSQQQKAYSTKIDIWSLGILAYHMIYRAYPFSRKELQSPALNYEIALPQMQLADAEFCTQLQEILRKMLTQSEQQRASAQELLEHQVFQIVKAKKEQIKQQIKRNFKVIKVQIQCSFHLAQTGYFFILSNQKKYLLHYDGTFSQLNDNRFKQLSSMKEYQLKTELEKLPKEQIENLKIFCLVDRLKKKFPFIKELKSNHSVFKEEKQVSLTYIHVIHKNIVMTKLSNKVIQFFFAKKQQSLSSFFSFDNSLSMNYNTQNQGEISFYKNSKFLRQRFQNVEKATQDTNAKKYVKYAVNVLRNLLHNSPVILSEFGLKLKNDS